MRKSGLGCKAEDVVGASATFEDSSDERNCVALEGAMDLGDDSGDRRAADLRVGGVFAGELLAGDIDLARSVVISLSANINNTQRRAIDFHHRAEGFPLTCTTSLSFFLALSNVGF